MSVAWLPKALEDLQAITRYLNKRNRSISQSVQNAIIAKADYLGDNIGTGSSIPDMPFEYKLGYTDKGAKYKIYYKVIDPYTIWVLAVRSSRQKPLTARQIKARG